MPYLNGNREKGQSSGLWQPSQLPSPGSRAAGVVMPAPSQRGLSITQKTVEYRREFKCREFGGSAMEQDRDHRFGTGGADRSHLCQPLSAVAGAHHGQRAGWTGSHHERSGELSWLSGRHWRHGADAVDATAGGASGHPGRDGRGGRGQPAAASFCRARPTARRTRPKR